MDMVRTGQKWIFKKNKSDSYRTWLEQLKNGSLKKTNLIGLLKRSIFDLFCPCTVTFGILSRGK
jgi:hypothetical protein